MTLVLGEIILAIQPALVYCEFNRKTRCNPITIMVCQLGESTYSDHISFNASFNHGLRPEYSLLV